MDCAFRPINWAGGSATAWLGSSRSRLRRTPARSTMMAIQSQGLETYVIDEICTRYHVDRAQYVAYRQEASDGSYSFHFKAIEPQKAIDHEMKNVRSMLDDPFRGPVIEAAVPELLRTLKRLLAEYELVHSPTLIKVPEREIREIKKQFGSIPSRPSINQVWKHYP